jgi:hypothetical protein
VSPEGGGTTAAAAAATAAVSNKWKNACVRVNRRIDGPVTEVCPFVGGVAGADWVSVTAAPLDSFTNAVNERHDESLFVCVAVLMLVLYLAYQPFKLVRKRATATTVEKSRKAALRELGGLGVKKQDLQTLMTRIRPTILKAVNNLDGCPTSKKASYELIIFDALANHYSRTAIRHIRDCYEGRNILSVCTLERHASSVPLRVYSLHASRAYALFVTFTIAVHICLAFFEPPTSQALKRSGMEPWTVYVELLCLIVEATDIVLQCLLIFKWHVLNVLTPKGTVRTLMAYTTVVAAVAVDWALAVTVSVSVEYWLPLRPLIMVLRNAVIRDAVVTFWRTLKSAWDVFVVFFLIVTTSAVFGVLLFRDHLASEATSVYMYSSARGTFRNIYNAFITMFIFISTGENYNELVYPAFSANPWFLAYFFMIIMVGMFFVLAMVIGTFEAGFRAQRDQNLQQQMLFTRLGSVAAFILLDLNMRAWVSRDAFEKFITHLAPYLKDNREVLKRLFDRMGKTSASDRIDISDFAMAIEELDWRSMSTHYRREREARWRVDLRSSLQQKWFRKTTAATSLLNIFIFCLYGSYDREYILDACVVTLFVAFLFEVSLKLVAFKFTRYWYFQYFVVDEQRRQRRREKVLREIAARTAQASRRNLRRAMTAKDLRNVANSNQSSLEKLIAATRRRRQMAEDASIRMFTK